ncbi:MAG: hypothetical protein JWQ38_2718 [Flavipsychrobacter sp.]|nr:hypothetical protein [Flavipsychrobacter sp.]
MKKLLFALTLLAATSAITFAQEKTTTVVKDDKVTKKTSTVPQKVHNTFSKKKHYNGRKTTHTKVVETKTAQ